MANWLSGNISDGFLLDAFQKYVDSELVNVPFEINEKNVYDAIARHFIAAFYPDCIVAETLPVNFTRAICDQPDFHFALWRVIRSKRGKTT